MTGSPSFTEFLMGVGAFFGSALIILSIPGLLGGLKGAGVMFALGMLSLLVFSWGLRHL